MEDQMIKANDIVKFRYPVDDIDGNLSFIVLEVIEKEFPSERKILVTVNRPWDGVAKVATFLYAESSLVKV
jgi:hypothetical protein